MSENKLVQLKKEGSIAYVTLASPPANALSQHLIQEIGGIFKGLKEDTSVKVVLLHGEGRFFAAGADIKEFTRVEDGKAFSKLARQGQLVFNEIESFPKPVIAAIHGAALGGGLELAMACHIRIAAENAKLGLPELQLGLIPGFAGTLRLPALVGKAKAAEMLLTSEPVTGTEAASLGLVNYAVPEENVLAEAEKLAGKIAKKGAVSVRHALQLLHFNTSENLGTDAGQVKEANSFGEVFESEDAKEGIQAFLEKRKPEFKDR
ncbi:enoyl-CoA hydratase [Evansella clarkii]|uniref:enoyl-CoA hydratase n=1 Tax=Evansella clarkii TaxID=79879 RepID=UPI001F2E0697|nr:enoyl-CoA hydratase [Evansella clarkii]